MIKTIYQFGEQLQKIEETKQYFEIFGAPYSERAESAKVIFAVIQNGKFDGFGFENYKKVDNGKYFFRELAASNATSIVPTLHFYNIPRGDKPEGFDKADKEMRDSLDKFLGKLERCLKANSKVYASFFEQGELMAALKESMFDYIRQDCNAKQNYLFTLQIDGKWLGEIPEVIKILEEEAYSKYYAGKSKDFKAEDKICALTYQKADVVWGKVDTLGFTVNDIPFSRNGFKTADSYKMFPVSPPAVKILEGAKRALESQFSYGFQNLNFFVLPRFVAMPDPKQRLKVVNSLVNNLTEARASGETQIQSIINNEEVFECIINKNELSQNSLYYDIFFYEQKQAQFSIKLHVSDVIPSRFKDILGTKKGLENYYKPWLITKQKPDGIALNFNEIKFYFEEPFFFQIMEAIFYGNPVQPEQVLTSFMRIIRATYNEVKPDPKKRTFSQIVRRTFVLYQYFSSLKIFKDMEAIAKAGVIGKHLRAWEFMEANLKFLSNNEASKAAFYLGCAVQTVLKAQQIRLKSQPFKHKLNGLNIDFVTMEKIVKEVKDKAWQYEEASKGKFPHNYFNQLLVVYTSHIAAANDEDTIKKVELSYAFTLGMVMEREFQNNRYEAKKDNKPEVVKEDEEFEED